MAEKTITATAIDDDVVVLTGTNGSNGVTYTASHANSGVTAGTYRSVTVNTKGHVTAGSNPDTLAGYGITDAYKKSEVYSKTEVDAELATKADNHDHPYASDTHGHGNITNAGTMTVAPLSATTNVAGVLVTDGSNKITRMQPATVRSLIGAGTSSLTLGTTANTAATGNHTHSGYEGQISAIESNYIRVGVDNNMYYGKDGTDYIIFDCGGAQ